MSVGTSSDWKVAIGPTTPAANAAAYAALTPWVEVGEISSLGEFGGQSADVTFASLSDNIVRHLKGTRDNGVLALTVGRDPLDVGQVAMRAAEKTRFAYAIRVTAADAPDEDHSDSIFYFHAIVQSARVAVGESDTVVTEVYNLGITTNIIEVPAEALP